MDQKPIVPTFEKYAIIQTGGKQYQAIPGKTIAVEKLEGNTGDTMDISEVVFRKTGEDKFEYGDPFIKDAIVKVSIIKQSLGPKIIIFRHKRRKKSRVKKGHRQPMTILRIEEI